MDMASFIQFVRTYFMTDLVSISVYVAIVALFFVCIIKCVMPIVDTRRKLRHAVRVLKKDGDAKLAWKDERFLGRGVLMSHWGEYLNNLLFADGEFHNPSSVEDYINEDTVIYGPGRATLGEAMPGLMVSLGFLGTLMGITMGLDGFDMTSSEGLMASIRQLVSGMQYAFMTSIVGVVASITSTLLIRIVSGSSIRTLDAFYKAMSDGAGIESVDPLTQIAIYQQEQTSLIHTMAVDLTGPMVDRLASALEKSLSPLKRSLDEFIAFTTRDQMRAVDSMVHRFIQALNESLHGQFQALGDTIMGTNRVSVQMQQDLTKTITDMQQMANDLVQVHNITGDMLTKFDSYVARLDDSHKVIDEGYARITANVEHLEIVARQQNGYLQSVGKLQSEIVRSVEGFQQSADRFMETFSADIAQTRAALGSVSDDIKANSSVLADSHRMLISGINKDMDQTYNRFFENTNRAVEHLTMIVSDVNDQIAAMPQLLDSTASLYASQADRLTDALRRAQTALDDAVDQLTRR